MSACPYGDPACPCVDGDACHYRRHGDSLAMRPPAEWWRGVPCGHPPNPVAWMGHGGESPTCHCGCFLDPGKAVAFVLEHDDGGAEWPLVPCSGCGCLVAVPQEAES